MCSKSKKIVTTAVSAIIGLGLSTMVATSASAGFGGTEVKLVDNMIHRLDEIEHDSDQQQIGIRSKLFKLENDMPPVNAVFLYKIIDAVGSLADHAQQVGGRLQLLLAR